MPDTPPQEVDISTEGTHLLTVRIYSVTVTFSSQICSKATVLCVSLPAGLLLLCEDRASWQSASGCHNCGS